MRKIYLLLIIFLLTGCSEADSSVNNNTNINLNYIDFTEATKDNIHLKNFSDLNLNIFEIETDGKFLYDISIGYKTYKFGEIVDDHSLIKSYGIDSEKQNYVSLLLENNETGLDNWDVVIRLYSEVENTSISSSITLTDFGTYVSSGSATPHNIELIPDKESNLIIYHYTNKNSYSIEGINGEVNNKEEMDYLLTWYVKVDNIKYKDEEVK